MRRTALLQFRFLAVLCITFFASLGGNDARAELKTWDGRHSIEKIEVTIVYFVPRDREPLPDWKDRVRYYSRRIEQFHAREFDGQSTLTTVMRPEPFRSARTTEQLRDGDGDFTFFQTLREVDGELLFGTGKLTAFPILLVLSEINWRPLDDFFRTKPGDNGHYEFEGNYSDGRHFPGANSGGARATYLADRGVGWGLVSGDGWRVPYSGSDCVVYHEGVGHPIGLPHPEPGNRSVMSMGQYHGWISESSVDDTQKKRLGWIAPDKSFDRTTDLFSRFTALPEPLVPKPDEEVFLKLTWPGDAKVESSSVRFQTELLGPWIEVPKASPVKARTREKMPLEPDNPLDAISLGRFDRSTPVSYRVDAVLENGRKVELWGYFQVRQSPEQFPTPRSHHDGGTSERASPNAESKQVSRSETVDLLEMVDVKTDRVSGDWTRTGSKLESPKAPGARIELPFQPPEEYELVIVVEPLDEPGGLILGQRLDGHRFVVLCNFANGANIPLSAIENIDGKNAGSNLTTVERSLFAKNRLSQIVCTAKKGSVVVTCDGHDLIDWSGDSKRLGLSNYWKTPHDESIFIGAYDCCYRFHRVTLTPLTGQGKKTR